MRLLVDVSSLAYPAYHKLKLTDSDGNGTGVIYGVLRAIERLALKLEPEEVVLVFDGGSNARQEIYQQYKANRKDERARADIRTQLSILRLVAGSLPLVVVLENGVEADDAISIIARFNHKEKVGIVTGDYDLYQLIRPGHKVVNTKGEIRKKLNIKKYGIQVSPKDIVLFKSLVGDSSDNINGVTGIGPVNAANLIAKYKDKKAILRFAKKSDGLGRDTYKVVRKKLRRNTQLIELNGSLVTTEQTKSILDQYRFGRLDRRINKKELNAAFMKLGFTSFITRMSGFLIPFRKMERQRRLNAAVSNKKIKESRSIVRKVKKVFV